jgi:DNA primase
LMRMDRLDFREALEQLADRAGIELSRGRGPGNDVKRSLYEVCGWAADRFVDCFQNTPLAKAAREYLQERGLSHETLSASSVGFAPNQWDWLLGQAQASGISTPPRTSRTCCNKTRSVRALRSVSRPYHVPDL